MSEIVDKVLEKRIKEQIKSVQPAPSEKVVAKKATPVKKAKKAAKKSRR